MAASCVFGTANAPFTAVGEDMIGVVGAVPLPFAVSEEDVLEAWLLVRLDQARNSSKQWLQDRDVAARGLKLAS